MLKRYSRAAGQTGKFTVPEWVEDKKKKKRPKGNKWSRDRGPKLIANVLRNRTEAQSGKTIFSIGSLFFCIIAETERFHKQKQQQPEVHYWQK